MSGVAAELRAREDAAATARALDAVRRSGPVPLESLHRRVRCQIIPPGRAVLCQNCGTVSDTPYDRCPVCESLALVNLMGLLDGKRRNEKHGQAA